MLGILGFDRNVVRFDRTQGKVYRGVDKVSKQAVAIKVFDQERVLRSEKLIRDLQRECAAMERLRHPNIITSLAVFQDVLLPKKRDSSRHRRVIAIVMELANGGELFGYLMHTNKFPESLARFYFRSMLLALQHAHENGVGHRDLKPENLLLSDQYVLKIGDWGLSAVFDDVNYLLQTFCGTRAYMAPEILARQRGAPPYAAAPVDVWSAGVVLFIMLAGCPPFLDAVPHPENWYFNRLADRNYPLFFTAHERVHVFSPDAKDLLSRMFEVAPGRRVSIDECLRHPWTHGAVPSQDSVIVEMNRRRDVILRIKGVYASPVSGLEALLSDMEADSAVSSASGASRPTLVSADTAHGRAVGDGDGGRATATRSWVGGPAAAGAGAGEAAETAASSAESPAAAPSAEAASPGYAPVQQPSMALDADMSMDVAQSGVLKERTLEPQSTAAEAAAPARAKPAMRMLKMAAPRRAMPTPAAETAATGQPPEGTVPSAPAPVARAAALPMAMAMPMAASAMQSRAAAVAVPYAAELTDAVGQMAVAQSLTITSARVPTVAAADGARFMRKGEELELVAQGALRTSAAPPTADDAVPPMPEPLTLQHLMRSTIAAIDAAAAGAASGDGQGSRADAREERAEPPVADDVPDDVALEPLPGLHLPTRLTWFSVDVGVAPSAVVALLTARLAEIGCERPAVRVRWSFGSAAAAAASLGGDAADDASGQAHVSIKIKALLPSAIGSVGMDIRLYSSIGMGSQRVTTAGPAVAGSGGASEPGGSTGVSGADISSGSGGLIVDVMRTQGDVFAFNTAFTKLRKAFHQLEAP